MGMFEAVYFLDLYMIISSKEKSRTLRTADLSPLFPDVCFYFVPLFLLFLWNKLKQNVPFP